MRPTKRLERAAGMLLASTLLQGCALLEVKLPEDPLAEREINTRLATHRFVDRFSQRVRDSADRIAANAEDEAILLNTLRWKIGATSAISTAAFQVSPRDALVDTWVYCIQMARFFRDGAATELFGAQQARAVETSEVLENDITGVARTFVPAADLPRYDAFVRSYADDVLLEQIDAERESAVPALYESLQLDPQTAVTTVGTLGQVVADFGSRLSVVSDQIPELTAWRSELYLRRSGVDGVSLRRGLDRFGARLERVAVVAEQMPQLLDKSIVRLNEELAILTEEIDRQRLSVLEALGRERVALMESVAQERGAVAQSLSEERAVTMRELEAYTDQLVDNVFGQLKGFAGIAIVGIIALILLLFGLPFGIGVLVGRLTKSSA